MAITGYAVVYQREALQSKNSKNGSEKKVGIGAYIMESEIAGNGIKKCSMSTGYTECTGSIW
jgi:hypothetical protein